MKIFLKIVLLFLFVVVPFGAFLIESFREIPEDVSYKSLEHRGDFEFLYDLTYSDSKGHRKSEQEIFSNVYKLIDDAENFLLLDFFLFNDDYDKDKYDMPALSNELTEALLKKKTENPKLPIVLITDPINTFYGGYMPENFRRLKEANIEVLVTDLDAIKDSNPLYTSFYRAYFRNLSTGKGQFLPNLFRKGEKVSISEYTKLLNFKANHRKVVVNEKEAIIASANPHDGSALHSNIAFKVKGAVLNDILESEKAIIRFSNLESRALEFIVKDVKGGEFEIQSVTEGKIKDALIDTIRRSKKGDKLFLGVFYLSHRGVIKELKKASGRDVEIRLILDLNKDAFGQKKIGIPNKQVANELSKEKNMEIKWYNTNGEQFHSKLLVLETNDEMVLVGGSANFTRRNLDDLNLESDVVIIGNKETEEMQKVSNYIDMLWYNRGRTYTLDYNTNAEDIWWKNIIYRVQEFSGLSTF